MRPSSPDSAVSRRHRVSSPPCPATARSASHALSRHNCRHASNRPIEPLAPIAERPDERDDGTILGPLQLVARGGALGCRDEGKPLRIRAVVDDARALRRDADSLVDVARRSRAVAQHDPGVPQRPALARQVVPMRGASLQPPADAARPRRVRRVQVVDPDDVAGVRIAAVGNHRSARERLRPPLPFGRQERSAHHVRSERTADAVDEHPARAHEIRPHTMRHEVHLSARRSRKAGGERVVRPVHAAERREVSRDQQPAAHASCSR